MSDLEFLLRTHLALTGLAQDAAKVRRNLPNPRHCCPDTAPCRSCAELRQIHLRADDYLDQLEEAALLASLEPA